MIADNVDKVVTDEPFAYLEEMSLEDFCKSARPFAPDADSLEKFRHESGYAGDFSALTMYAEGFIIEKREGVGYLPHAWWYAPIAYTLKEEAEQLLWNWRNEFTKSLPELPDGAADSLDDGGVFLRKVDEATTTPTSPSRRVRVAKT